MPIYLLSRTHLMRRAAFKISKATRFPASLYADGGPLVSVVAYAFPLRAVFVAALYYKINAVQKSASVQSTVEICVHRPEQSEILE